MLLGFIVLLGVLGLVAGYVAHRRVRARLRERGKSWWRVQLAPLGVSLALYTVTFLRTYPLNPSTRILGLPFPVAAWEKHGDVWLDFVGPFTLPALIANAAFMFLVPQLFVLWRLRRTG